MEEALGKATSGPSKAVLDVKLPRMRQGSEALVSYEYEFHEANGGIRGPMLQEFQIDVNQSNISRFCIQMREVVEQSLAAGEAKGRDHMERLAELGRMLYRELFPRQQGSLPDLANRVREASELLIRTNEALVPWELVHDGEEFFCFKYELGRQYVVSRWVHPGREIRMVQRALLIADPTGDRPGAREEATALVDQLEGLGVECTVLAVSEATVTKVVRALSGNYDLLHYSGHVRISDPSERAALVLHDGELGGDTVLIHANPIPVVLLNGCASAEPLSNLCASFMETGSRVVLGTVNRVDDVTAQHLSESLYGRLLNGVPVGMAMREARQQIAGRPDAGWASFVLYGDPAASIVETTSEDEVPHAVSRGGDRDRDEQSPKVNEGLPPAGLAPSVYEGFVGDTRSSRLPDLSVEAAVFLKRVARFAGAGGFVSSVDLMLGLLEADEPMRRALGHDRATLLGHFREHFASGDANQEAVRLSDTVVKVLATAEGLAYGDGRQQVSVRDIARAFVDVGGGESSRAILESLGMTIEDLDPDKEPVRGRSPCELGSSAVELSGDEPSSMFDSKGALSLEYASGPTVAALRAAERIARREGTFISSAMLLVGFGQTSSPALVECLQEQGEVGLAAARSLLLVRHPHLNLKGFSSRSFRAIEAALAAEKAKGAKAVDDAAVLVELLSDERSTACKLLRELGVDVERLVSSLAERG